MVDGLPLRMRFDRLESSRAQSRIVGASQCPALGGPLAEVLQLNRQDLALQALHSLVVADEIMLVFGHSSVIAQFRNPLAQRGIDRDDGTGVPAGAKIFGRVKAKRAADSN